MLLCPIRAAVPAFLAPENPRGRGYFILHYRSAESVGRSQRLADDFVAGRMSIRNVVFQPRRDDGTRSALTS
jgi:hypothetical protein